MNPSKIYVIDTGLAGCFSVTPDRGKRLENAVFHYLRRQQQRQLYYLANGHEVDFSSADDHPKAAWNVTWSIDDPATHQREIDALEWARQHYPGIETTLICHENSQAWKHDPRQITAWKLLLGGCE